MSATFHQDPSAASPQSSTAPGATAAHHGAHHAAPGNFHDDDAPEALEFESFSEFYPFYLSEHSNRTSRRLHFVGSLLSLAWFLGVLAAGQLWLVPLALVIGYAFAWIGHFQFEKNKPATFKRPLYSFLGDWVMFKDILVGRIPF